jgi:signal transduction histidine kinase
VNFLSYRTLLLKVTVLALGCLPAAAQTVDPGVAGAPARAVSRYVLTSTAQSDSHDPTAWRLLASNDGGAHWVTLDRQTNQQFAARSQQNLYAIRNRKPFYTYRLQVDAVKSSDVNVDMSVQLAGFDLIGPLVNVTDESKLQTAVSASSAHPVVGPPEFAFDDDPTTSWWDCGFGTPGGCWLQVHYTTNSPILVTNLSQASLLTRVSATRSKLANVSTRILSDLTAQVASPRRLVGYALTSANDTPERDPRDWKLVGSNDGGKTWTEVDRRLNETFANRLERRIFSLTNAAAFRRFRLQISATRTTNYPCQLAEMEPIYADPQADAHYSLVVDSIADNPPLESVEMAFDGDQRSKWLCFYAADPTYPLWLQWQLTPRVEDLPVISQRQLELMADRGLVKEMLEQTNPVAVRIRGYALMSANDFGERDPRDWRLLASRDGGSTWGVLDRREGELFTERGQRRQFNLAQPVIGQIFRLQIDSIRSPSPTNIFANSVQLAELEPIYDDPETAAGLTVVASSQGENSPMETVDELFDGKADTKWLDYSPATTNHASWVEWRYVKGPTHRVINLNRQQANAALLPDAFELQLPAKILFVDHQTGRVGLGDDSGFLWASLNPWPEGLVPGVQTMLSGQLSVRGGQLFVSRARLDDIHPLPPQSTEPGASPNFTRGSVVGRVNGVFAGPSYCGATLERSDGLLFEARLPGKRFPMPPNLACPVKFDGVIESLIAGRSGRIPSLIWAADPGAITFAPSADEDWNALPDYSTNLALPSPVHVCGGLEPGAANRCFILANGHRISLELREPLAMTGTNAEAAGMLMDNGGQFVLHNACLRAPRATGSTTNLVLSGVSEVQQFLHSNPNGSAAAKIKGIITFIDLNVGDFYVQDGDIGLDVLGQMNAGLFSRQSEEGSYVEVRGTVVSGGLVATSFAQVLGKGRMPRPAQPSWESLLSGAMDNRWVEVEGTIAAMERQRFTVAMGANRLTVWINELDETTARSFAGSLARVRGVCSSIVNTHNQRLGVRLLVPSSEYIDLLGLAPEKPFALPLTPMTAVMSADTTLTDPQQRYVRTRGVITCQQGRLLFLQDQTTGLRVMLRDDFEAAPGEVVEVVGRPQPDGFSAKLIQAVIRKVDHAPLPTAVPVDLASVNLGDLTQQQDATRVALEGVLINEMNDATRRTLNLRNEAARQVFSVYLPLDDPAGPMAPIPEGSRLRVLGIFKAVQDKTPDVGQAATTFEVYANSTADITVLERPSWWTARHTLRVVAVFAGGLAVSLAWIWLLRKRVQERTSDLAAKVDELKRSEVSLAAEIAERKRLQAKADQAHKQLLAVARQAGMAEVATGILHNVGNVLNSVNVSATVAMDRLRGSRIDGLEKAVALLRQNQTDLATFLHTERGQNLLSYLGQLSSHIAASQNGTMQELESLDKNVQHIKDIVAVQQDYARCSGLTEKMQVAELVEDALRITASSLEQHKIKIISNFDCQTPPVEADRHRVLQILVNVLQNAQQACDESHRADKMITIAIGVEGKNISISVTDNGVGIAPENLERIFQHGFTTRRHGHGFGLHNAALTAKEMGGSLRVESPGAGLGAKFTLKLPLERNSPGPAPA